MARSTYPEVERLLDAFAGLPRDGQILFHLAVEEVAQTPRTDRRYRPITRRFRERLLEEHNILLDGMSARGQGWVVRTSWQMITYGTQAMTSIERTLTKTTTVLQRAAPQELEPHQQKVQAHLLKYTSSLLAHLVTARADLPTPPLTPKARLGMGAMAS